MTRPYVESSKLDERRWPAQCPTARTASLPWDKGNAPACAVWKYHRENWKGGCRLHGETNTLGHLLGHTRVVWL